MVNKKIFLMIICFVNISLSNKDTKIFITSCYLRNLKQFNDEDVEEIDYHFNIDIGADGFCAACS